MPPFHDILFPTAIARASTGGPERRTRIVTLASGHEQRSTPWADSRRRFDAGYGLRSLADLHEVVAFFEARRGPLHGFRWRDAADHLSCAPGETPSPTDQPLGSGDGETPRFALSKTYTSGAQGWTRPIALPAAGSVRAALDGVETPCAVEGGEIVFTAPPPPGVAVTAGFAFDTPVRFDTDSLSINLAGFEAGEIPSIPIVEIRL